MSPVRSENYFDFISFDKKKFLIGEKKSTTQLVSILSSFTVTFRARWFEPLQGNLGNKLESLKCVSQK